MIGRPPKYDWDAIRALVLAGTMTLSEAAAKFRVPHGTITNRAVRENWQLTKTFGRPKSSDDSKKSQIAKAKQAKSIQTLKLTAADVFADNASASKVHLSGAIRKASAHLEGMDEDKLIANHQAIASVSKSASSTFGWNQPDFSHKYFDVRMLAISRPPPEDPLQQSFSDQPPQLPEESDHSFRDIQP